MSAGIMSPADRCTMSPGTRSSNGTSPFSLTRASEASSRAYRLVTVAVVRTIARRDSAARDERYSWKNRITTLTATITETTAVPLRSPVA